MMSKSKNSTRVIAVVAVVAIAIGIYIQKSQKTAPSLPKLSKVVILPNTKALDHVRFSDHHGNPFTTEHLKGYWSILFFAFTHCPDICPTTMQTLQQVKEQLSKENKWGNYRVIMVSVDPERDTTERLNNYVPYFDEEFIGLRGDVNSTAEFAKQMGILFVKRQTSENYYEVDHSASLILVNPAGEMAGVITAPHQAEQISGDLGVLADHFADDHQQAPLSPETAANLTANEESASAAMDTMSMPHSTMPADQGATIDGLILQDAWIRPPPPNAASMAAYFTLQNQSDSEIAIVGIEAPGFAMAMVHDTVIEGDMASMQHQDKLVIPAGGEVILAPLGTHLMLMQPNKSLAIGESVEITLVAANGARLTQLIKVKQPEG